MCLYLAVCSSIFLRVKLDWFSYNETVKLKLLEENNFLPNENTQGFKATCLHCACLHIHLFNLSCLDICLFELSTNDYSTTRLRGS